MECLCSEPINLCVILKTNGDKARFVEVIQHLNKDRWRPLDSEDLFAEQYVKCTYTIDDENVAVVSINMKDSEQKINQHLVSTSFGELEEENYRIHTNNKIIGEFIEILKQFEFQYRIEN